MIQELLGGSRNVGLIEGEKSKFSTPIASGGILDGSSSLAASPVASPSTAAIAAAAATTPAATSTTSENLRCPRCDSSNTKFCYYNNYNLTQPRHFCKTCRRYWTKGGVLRNIPIGGGCRKNKSSAINGKSNSLGKLRAVVTPESGKLGMFCGGEILSASPVIWGASSQNSHFRPLIKGNPNPNPNHNQIPNSVSFKDNTVLFGSSNLCSESSISCVGGMNARVMALDPLGQHLHGNQTQGNIHAEVHDNNGLQELYQSLRSSAYREHSPFILGNVASANSSTTSSAVLESSPVGAGELGLIWSPVFPWPSDLSTAANGAYP